MEDVQTSLREPEKNHWSTYAFLLGQVRPFLAQVYFSAYLTQESAATYVADAATPVGPPSLEYVMALASRLALTEQLQVIQRLAAQLSETTRTLATPQSRPKKSRSLHSLLADLGPGPTAEVIDESRREMLANFPREDF